MPTIDANREQARRRLGTGTASTRETEKAGAWNWRSGGEGCTGQAAAPQRNQEEGELHSHLVLARTKNTVTRYALIALSSSRFGDQMGSWTISLTRLSRTEQL